MTNEDFANGTFTVSSVGNLGGKYFVPTILRPQGAIVAIGKAHKYPSWEESTKSFRPIDIVNFSYTCDHRVIDGATCAHFSEHFKKLIEDPAKMIVSMV